MFTKTIYTPILFFIKSQVSSAFLADFRVDGNFIVFSKNLILFFVQRIFYTKFNENILIRSTIVFLNYLFLSWPFFFYIFKISEILPTGSGINNIGQCTTKFLLCLDKSNCCQGICPVKESI